MHALFELVPTSHRLRRLPLVVFVGGILWLALLALPPAARGQAFVAEWALSDIGRLGPTGMALDTVGGTTYLYVADQPFGRVIKINVATGARVGVWGQTGNGPLEFNSPFGIAVDPVSHDIYVAERGNHRVQRLTSSGQFVMGWGELGSGPGQFDGPIGIAADASGNVYVVDHNNNRIQKFHVQQTSAGWQAQFVKTWGGPGSAVGQFNAPYGITLDSRGVLWVADGRNHRIQKFDTNGSQVGTIGTYGTGDGQFVTPTWVNFDASGSYYVAETNTDPQNTSATDLQNQRIQKFSSTGTFQLKWGSYGETGGQFKLPFDVVVDAGGYAYVADYYNMRLQKFSMNEPPSTGGGGSSTASFSNVSSRLRTNANSPLIAGFVISGSVSKRVLIRAVGPTLTQFGVTNTLPNPKLRVYSGSTLVAENEDWGGDAAVSAATTSTGTFALASGSKDAALVATLAPGLYSAQVVDNGGDGIAVVEVYDLDAAAGRLINLSTRGFVDTGDGVLVAGIVVTGSTPKKVLIRGVGPTLATFGVTGSLSDPVLRVYGANNTLVAQNDNWGTPQTVSGGATPATAAEISAAATATNAFGLPSGSKDAAVVVTLQPGAYSAVINGSANTTGTGLVEVYEIP